MIVFLRNVAMSTRRNRTQHAELSFRARFSRGICIFVAAIVARVFRARFSMGGFDLGLSATR